MWMQLYNNTMEGAIFSDALCSFIELEPYKIIDFVKMMISLPPTVQQPPCTVVLKP